MNDEIKQTLSKQYEIEMDDKSIQDLTFGILLSWSSEKKKLISLESQETWSNDIITDLKLGNCQQNVFFLHQIDGNTNQLTSLAMLLNANVYGLQCTSECKFELIQEFGNSYENIIRKKQPEGPYVLCGYSYGVLLVLEIASILEAKGYSVKAICIGVSPDFSRSVADQLFENNVEHWNGHEKMLIDFAMKNACTDREQV